MKREFLYSIRTSSVPVDVYREYTDDTDIFGHLLFVAPRNVDKMAVNAIYINYCLVMNQEKVDMGFDRTFLIEGILGNISTATYAEESNEYFKQNTDEML